MKKEFFLLVLIIFMHLSVIGQSNTPKAAEAASFEQVDATDMVDLLTGDMTYVLPILNIPSPEGGYPISLVYHGGIGYELESSWIGLGWNLNPGSIVRNVNGNPDDWSGAQIYTREYFEYQHETYSGSVGWGDYNAALSYSEDSNKAKSGSVSIGYGKEGSGYSIRAGVGYSTEDGLYGTIGAGLNSKVGKSDGGTASIGLNADTRGNVSGGFGFGKNGIMGNKDTFGAGHPLSLGMSFSVYKGRASVGLNLGASSLSNSSYHATDIKTIGYHAAFYLYGVQLGLNYTKTKMTREKMENDKVWGSLYYNEIITGNNGNNTYGNLFNEQNRNSFMDTYQQEIPKTITNFIKSDDIFEKQNNNFSLPAYDKYIVNAQGLTGILTSNLFENGMLINEGLNIEYDNHVHNGLGSSQQCAENWFDNFLGQFQGPINGAGKKITRKTFFSNNHYNQNKKFTKNIDKLYFYFNNHFPNDVVVDNFQVQNFNNASNIDQYLSGSQNSINIRKQNSSYTEFFTNEKIKNNQVRNFLEAKDYDRINDSGFRNKGIGGYRITTSDGKTYHYSRPVYHFEQIYRSLFPKVDEAGDPDGYHSDHSYYNETRKTEPYASHWLLTAITGPDYVKNSTNVYPSEGDFGYWIRFDYGKWTDGYIWRNPQNGGYLKKQINENLRTAGYSWGRKQLVYLDKIVTRTHTALFVKSVRDDNKGYAISNYPSVDGDGKKPWPIMRNGVEYPSQSSLKLDEIILIKNGDDNINTSNITNIVTNPNANHTVNWVSIPTMTFNINQQDKVLDSGDLTIDATTGDYNIYNKAQKIIKLNNQYILGKGSVNSQGTDNARLTLLSVKQLGKKGVELIPDYSFDYLNKDLVYNACFDEPACSNTKDDWGFNKNTPEAWTLNEITTPTGSKLQFEYERDKYYTEAFSRPFWTDNLTFKITNFSSTKYKIRIENSPNSPNFPNENIDFSDYFEVGQTSIDLWLVNRTNIQDGSEWNPFCLCFMPPRTKRYGTVFDLNSQLLTGDDFPKVINVAYNHLEIIVEKNINGLNIMKEPWNSGDYISGKEYWKHEECPATHKYEQTERGSYPIYVEAPANHNHRSSRHTMTYNLVANKVPGTGTGGGIRVAKIKSIDEIATTTYTSEYSYNYPNTSKTSGITSYAPSKNNSKFIAYEYQIPSPRVMYEYVTIKGESNNNLETIQYHFDVIKPVANIFNPQIKSGEHFEVNVSTNEIDSSNKTKHIDVSIHDNTSSIGSLISVKNINSKNQIISSTTNKFYTLAELKNSPDSDPYRKGKIKESFHSLKSIYRQDDLVIVGTASTGIYSETRSCNVVDGLTFNLKQRILNTTSKTIYPATQRYTKTTEGGYSFKTEYKFVDPKSGRFLEQYSTKSGGAVVRVKSIPAYTKYSEMGSKVDFPKNKHMLTQEAMNITKISNKTVNASITTWDKDWTYRDNYGNEPNSSSEFPVWRKHKSFVWKGNVNSNGAYLTNISEDDFNWGIGDFQNDNWQKAFEITRYTHWSLPIEGTDINNNFISSKRADNFSKTIASGNARYTEMYYSGAEKVASGNTFEGEVKGANFQVTEINYYGNPIAHTGDNAVKNNNPNDRVFEVTVETGNDFEDLSKNFRPGKYKVSFWALVGSGNQSVALMKDGTVIKKSEVISAGKWSQFNYIVDFPSNSNFSIYVTDRNNGNQYFDDFRMHPVYASMTSYVYDKDTDELSYILGANNLATYYCYDGAGRLCKVFNEVVNDGHVSGGFKLASKNKYHYKNIPTTDCGCMYSNILDYSKSKASFVLEEIEKGSFSRTFEVTGLDSFDKYTFEWQWLTDVENNIYSNYVIGDIRQLIPFTPQLCNENSYNKIWDFNVKITNTETSEVIIKVNRVELKDCKYEMSSEKWADIEISTNYESCSKNTNYTFRIFTIKQKHENYLYEYQTYNPISDNWSTYIDVTSNNGIFCPTNFVVESLNCKEERMNYYEIRYRATDLNTNAIYISPKHCVYLECTFNNFDKQIFIETNEEMLQYAKQGNILLKNDNDEIIKTYNILDEQNNYKK